MVEISTRAMAGMAPKQASGDATMAEGDAKMALFASLFAALGVTPNKDISLGSHIDPGSAAKLGNGPDLKGLDLQGFDQDGLGSENTDPIAQIATEMDLDPEDPIAAIAALLASMPAPSPDGASVAAEAPEVSPEMISSHITSVQTASVSLSQMNFSAQTPRTLSFSAAASPVAPFQVPTGSPNMAAVLGDQIAGQIAGQVADQIAGQIAGQVADQIAGQMSGHMTLPSASPSIDITPKAVSQDILAKIDQFWSDKWSFRLAAPDRESVYTIQAQSVFHYQTSYEMATAWETSTSLAPYWDKMPPQLTLRDIQSAFALRATSVAENAARTTEMSSSGDQSGQGQYSPASAFIASSTLNNAAPSSQGDGVGFEDLPSLEAEQLDLMAKDWEKKLAERIGRAIAEGLDDIEVEMNPRNLGRVQLQLSMDGNDIRVRLLTETSLAAQLLSDSEQRLAHHMDSLGMRLSDFYSGQQRHSRGQSEGDRQGADGMNPKKPNQGTGQEAEDLVETARNVHSYGINVTA